MLVENGCLFLVNEISDIFKIVGEQFLKIPIVERLHTFSFLVGLDINLEIFWKNKTSQKYGSEKMRIHFPIPEKQKLHCNFFLEIGSTICKQMMNVVIFHLGNHCKTVLFVEFAEFSTKRIFFKSQ